MTERPTQPPTVPPTVPPTARLSARPFATAPEPLPDLIKVNGAQRGLVARVALVLVALVLFALGIVFWLVPVLSGIPFWVLGFLVLGSASRSAARWINRQESRLPRSWRLLLRPRHRRELKAQARR